jgi:uncharacterized protein (DUF433 family)
LRPRTAPLRLVGVSLVHEPEKVREGIHGSFLGAVSGAESHRDAVYGRMVIMIDWSRCADVESKPDVMSGAFVVRGTRVLAQAVIDNANDGYTAEQIVTEIYPSLPVEPARRVIAFARRTHAAAAAP